ncbi:stage III sporulation protein AC [Desulfitobacterium dichloroeliminans LMG P-21439]|uniref:Stage III sporulation protein AC n=3 Tax=Desulfitobacterium TaxID=36853 RepID=L0FA88_DESDL|nr:MULTISPECIES: stage III sporulation protein AC [Desulfitobacterium]AFM01252.1 stage III sporulation protein AC [Desulfitobacterium dehalogenans ATCC 51507]AGA69863.1 stage III sporulation protein AC [Desulfitobacterium dichloroeliminans LMG P-21439]HHY25475.1 stage III sporulation protein AC [Desulfitobacterium dehalogenans]
MDFYMVMKIAGIGLLVGVLVMVLEQANRKDIAQLTVLAGVVVVLYIVVQAVADLFNLVRSVFQIY